jgi:ketosteroid isomerase-like protein
MPIVAEIILPGVTPEAYDAVRAGAGWLTEAPTGGLGHVTWWQGDDCYSIDAWESAEALDEFAQHRLGPAMARAGVSASPVITVHPAHEVFMPRQVTVAPTADASTAADNVGLVRDGYAAFAARDMPAVLALLHEDVVWTTPDTVALGGTYVGAAAVGGFFARLPENYTELRVEPERFVDRGDCVVVLGHHRGTTRAGSVLDLPFVHVWTMSSGKALAFTEHFDTARMNLALGVPAQVDVRTSAPAGA